MIDTVALSMLIQLSYFGEIPFPTSKVSRAEWSEAQGNQPVTEFRAKPDAVLRAL